MTVSTINNQEIHDYTSGDLTAKLYLSGGSHRGLRQGFIGNLDCTASDADAAALLTDSADRVAFLLSAKEQLFHLGAQIVIGPMDGDTWHRYRLPIGNRASLTFLEPDYPIFKASDFISAGMPVLATYHSSLISDLALAVETSKRCEHIEVSSDLGIRNLQLSDFDNELDQLYTFSNTAFKTNFLYTGIDRQSFKALYQPLKNILQEDLVLLVEDKNNGEILGAIVALPDIHNKSMLIAKTIARSPHAPNGTGRFLFHTLIERAQALGYSSVLCALIKDDNYSSSLPEGLGGKPLNKFALFGCTK